MNMPMSRMVTTRSTCSTRRLRGARRMRHRPKVVSTTYATRQTPARPTFHAARSVASSTTKMTSGSQSATMRPMYARPNSASVAGGAGGARSDILLTVRESDRGVDRASGCRRDGGADAMTGASRCQIHAAGLALASRGVMSRVVCALLAAACGDGSNPPAGPDAGVADLANPAPGEWPMFKRRLDHSGVVPPSEMKGKITAATVCKRWERDLTGPNRGASGPLIADIGGTWTVLMSVAGPMVGLDPGPGRIYALDGK